MVYGTEGTPCSCLTSGWSCFRCALLLTPFGGSKADIAELSCSEAFQRGHLGYPHECLSLSRGLLLLTPTLHLGLLELSADTPHNPPQPTA